MPLSDRELTLATFLAVTALAKRLTGEDMSVTIQGQDGLTHRLKGDDDISGYFTSAAPLPADPGATAEAPYTPSVVEPRARGAA